MGIMKNWRAPWATIETQSQNCPNNSEKRNETQIGGWPSRRVSDLASDRWDLEITFLERFQVVRMLLAQDFCLRTMKKPDRQDLRLTGPCPSVAHGHSL